MKPYLYRADHPAAVCRKKPTACRPPNSCLQEEADGTQTTQRLSARRNRQHADHPTAVRRKKPTAHRPPKRLSARRSRQHADHPAAVLNETNEICANHVYIYFTEQTKAITLSINHLQNQKSLSNTGFEICLSKSNKCLQFRGSKFGDALARQYL